MKTSAWGRTGKQVRLISKDPLLLIIIILILASLITFILYPLFRVIAMSVFPQGRFSLSVMREVIASWYMRQAFLNSVMMGSLTAVFGVIVVTNGYSL